MVVNNLSLLTYDDAAGSSVRVHRLVGTRVRHHVIGSLVALHAGFIQARRATSTAGALKVLVVLGLHGGTQRNGLHQCINK